MATQKACKQCKAIVEGSKCSQCGTDELSDSFKGKVTILNPESSEIAGHLKLNKKGAYAIKIG